MTKQLVERLQHYTWIRVVVFHVSVQKCSEIDAILHAYKWGVEICSACLRSGNLLTWCAITAFSTATWKEISKAGSPSWPSSRVKVTPPSPAILTNPDLYREMRIFAAILPLYAPKQMRKALFSVYNQLLGYVLEKSNQPSQCSMLRPAVPFLHASRKLRWKNCAHTNRTICILHCDRKVQTTKYIVDTTISEEELLSKVPLRPHIIRIKQFLWAKLF